MPANDGYQIEIDSLRAALAGGILTVESNGRRITYRNVSEIKDAIAEFEALGGRRRRTTRFRAASFTRP